jgi:hypothetical protein
MITHIGKTIGNGMNKTDMIEIEGGFNGMNITDL